MKSSSGTRRLEMHRYMCSYGNQDVLNMRHGQRLALCKQSLAHIFRYVSV